MRFSWNEISRTILLISICLLFTSRTKPTQARDNFWDGSFNDSWNIAANWHFAGTIVPIPRVPADIDTAVLAGPLNDTVRLFGNTAPIDGLIVGNGIDLFTNGFFLEVDKAGDAIATAAGGGRISVEPRFGGRRAFETDKLFLLSDGVVSLQGGDALVEGQATLTDGGGIHGSNAASNIRFGGDISMDQAVIRLFNGADASFSANTTLLAEFGSIAFLKQQINVINGMTFDFRSGSRLEVESLNIGNNGFGIGSVGSLLLDADGSTAAKVTVDLDLNIGHATNGAGLLDMKDSIASIIGKTTVLSTGTIQLDDTQFAAHGELLVDGGTVTSVNETNPLFLPVGGKVTATNGGTISIDGSQEIRADGTFEFFSGADLDVTGTMTVGTDVGSTGTLTLDGAGTTLAIGTDLIVGDEQQEGIVGLSGTAVGNVTGNIEIGTDGLGTLTVESGATLSGGFGRVGGSFGSSATATVTGAGSTWNNSSFLSIGSSGVGQLNINDGGQVFSASSFLGADSNAAGTVTVSGEDSAWTIAGSLKLGGGSFGDLGGSATLTVQTGGAVDVATSLIVYSSDLLRLAGGTLTAQTIDLRGGQLQWTAGTLHTEMSLDNILNQGGTLAPGKSTPGDEIGLTTIDGNYTQQTDGALAIEIAGVQPITTYDQVSVTGFALLDGDLELATLGFQPQPSDTFTILSALGGIAGVFDNVLTGGRLDTIDGFGSFLVHYGPGSLFNDNQIVLSDFQPGSADVDHDGDVDGSDFLLIQRTNPALIPLWESQYGSSSAVASSQAVPEPSTVWLALLASLALGGKPATYFDTFAARCHTGRPISIPFRSRQFR